MSADRIIRGGIGSAGEHSTSGIGSIGQSHQTYESSVRITSSQGRFKEEGEGVGGVIKKIKKVVDGGKRTVRGVNKINEGIEDVDDDDFFGGLKKIVDGISDIDGGTKMIFEDGTMVETKKDGSTVTTRPRKDEQGHTILYSGDRRGALYPVVKEESDYEKYVVKEGSRVTKTTPNSYNPFAYEDPESGIR